MLVSDGLGTSEHNYSAGVSFAKLQSKDEKKAKILLDVRSKLKKSRLELKVLLLLIKFMNILDPIRNAKQEKVAADVIRIGMYFAAGRGSDA